MDYSDLQELLGQLKENGEIEEDFDLRQKKAILEARYQEYLDYLGGNEEHSDDLEIADDDPIDKEDEQTSDEPVIAEIVNEPSKPQELIVARIIEVPAVKRCRVCGHDMKADESMWRCGYCTHKEYF